MTSQSNQYAVAVVETALGICRGTNVVVQPFDFATVRRTPGNATFTTSVNTPVCKRPE